MKPPISYYGGKQRMSPKIVPLIPQHTVYVEPFCGSAAILFAKPFPKVTNTNHYREFINDLDGNLINFFKQLRDNGEEFIRFLELTPYSSEIHQEYKSKNFHKYNDLERAVAYWYNITNSFSNIIDKGWAKGKYSKNLTLTYLSKIEGLYEAVQRVRQVGIFNWEASKIISQMDSPQTFFYCDPPYPNTEQGYNENGFTEKHFQELVDQLESCKGSFILSCYDNMNVTIPDSWEKFEFSAQCSVSKIVNGKREGGKRTEVVYRRFNTEPVRPELQKLYDSGKFDCFVKKDENNSKV